MCGTSGTSARLDPAVAAAARRRGDPMISRVLCLACLMSLAALPPVAAQRASRIPRIGFLCLIPCTDSPIRDGLRDLGYVDGKNALFETRSADGVADRLPALAAELVKLNVDVIVAQHGVPATEAAKHATATIPIVFTAVGDPVAFGLVANLARPAGNITGVAFLAPEMTRKQFELLHEAVPSVSRVVVFRNADNPADIQLARDRQSAAQALRLTLQEIDVRTPADFERVRRRDQGPLGCGLPELRQRDLPSGAAHRAAACQT